MNYLFKLSPLLTLLPIFFILLGGYLRNISILLVGLFLFYFLFFFFRVPPKTGVVPVHRDPILSPAYGTVREIKKIGGYYHVVITLSLFDVHVQYVPYGGIVRKKMYKKGEFNMVYFLNKSQYNERMVTIFDTKLGPITVSQIAGVTTRRIHNFARPLQIMKKGEHLGFICFGSRVDMLIPVNDSIRLGVNVGDRLVGGETVIAYTK